MTDAGDRPVDWIDSLIHAPARLQIVMQLYVVDGADATFLLNRTGVTNYHVSVQVLSIAITVVVLIKHKSNISRLLAGQEPALQRHKR